MGSRKTKFRSVKLSLKDLLGKEYIQAVVHARSFLAGDDPRQMKALAEEKVDFYPPAFQQRLLQLLPQVGTVCCPPLKNSAQGGTTDEFRAHSKRALAPVGGLGFYRVGEDGRLFLISKSEHYHVPLGHGFPGYHLINHARTLGIPNATHNNTRGHITRKLEEELIRTAAGISPGDHAALEKTLQSNKNDVLNRVLNLETGSLAAEAAIKMVLARFYRPQADSPQPKYHNRIPVLVVIGDEQGNLQANYHGTTVIAQMQRGMWPDFIEQCEKQKTFLIRCVRPNNLEDLESVFARYEQEKYKIAGFFHELVMMNYGATRLTEKFILRIYALCKKHDVPTIDDEIQSCVWSPQLYMYREYGIQPTFVVVGKGFPGGEYPASRIIFSSTMDTLPQFGALVTNGQEELASLAYLVTIRWAEANAEITSAIGEYYEEQLRVLADHYPTIVHRIEGKRHLAGMYFNDLESGKRFTSYLNNVGLDISVQTYKEGSPPSALTKLPLTAGYEVVDVVIDCMKDALKHMVK
ncbi:MAG: aminotransferase class III-fold pyridoxal phosphate-dependent enzyme [Candidatus Omnitrophota bacterium]|nr:MAG: aminotransferase class III-fold pyridoxal phosphate-dependent enzyme [Candidatus Omnitrophota bacterium]